MGSGPSHEKDDPNNHPNNHSRDPRGSIVESASMRRMHWIIYDAKGKHSIIAEHDVITGRRLLVADGTQIVYRKRVLMDRGDTFPFTIGSGVYLHHCVAFIRDMEGKFLYGLVVDGMPIHEYHQKFFQNALYYTFPITVSPFSPTHQYTPSSHKSEPSPLLESIHTQNLAGIEECASPLESDALSPQDAASVIDTLTTSAVVSRRKSRDVSLENSPEPSLAAAISTQSSLLNPATGERSAQVTPRGTPTTRHGPSKSVVSSIPTVPPTSASVPASATYTIHDPRDHTCIVITQPQLSVLIDDEPVELHSQFAELATEILNQDNHVHEGEEIHISHHDANHEPPAVDGTVHGFTCDSFLTVCELIARPITQKPRASVGTRSTLSPPISGGRRSLTIHTGNTDTIPLITPSPHGTPSHRINGVDGDDEKKEVRSRAPSASPIPGTIPEPTTTATATAPTVASTSTSPIPSPAAMASRSASPTSPTSPTSTNTLSTPVKSYPKSLFEYELRVNGFVQEALPPPPVPYFNQVAIQEQQAMEIPVPRLRIEYEKWRESHTHSQSHH